MDTSIYEQVLVCYDVVEDRRRQKLCDALLDLGLQRIQYSVFWGYLTSAEHRAVLRCFSDLLDKERDRAVILPVRLRERLSESAFGYDQDDLPELSNHAFV